MYGGISKNSYKEGYHKARTLTFGSSKPEVLQDSILLEKGVKPIFIDTEIQKLFRYLQINTYLTRLVDSAY